MIRQLIQHSLTIIDVTLSLPKGLKSSWEVPVWDPGRFEREEVLKWNEDIPIYAHYKLNISGKDEDKDQIIRELQLLNITHENLFPGLDSSVP